MSEGTTQVIFSPPNFFSILKNKFRQPIQKSLSSNCYKQFHKIKISINNL